MITFSLIWAFQFVIGFFAVFPSVIDSEIKKYEVVPTPEFFRIVFFTSIACVFLGWFFIIQRTGIFQRIGKYFSRIIQKYVNKRARKINE